MPQFEDYYREIVLGIHVEVLLRAYCRAGGIDVEDAPAETLAWLAEKTLAEHANSVQTLASIAQHLLYHHLLTPLETYRLMTLLGRENSRFLSGGSNETKNHARYASRYVFQELDALIAKFPALSRYGRDEQQPDAWLPLSRHLVRELVVRRYAYDCLETSELPSWESVLTTLMRQLDRELRDKVAPVVAFSDWFATADPDNDWTILDLISTDDVTWLPASQSVGSNYDRKDADGIRHMIHHSTATADAEKAPTAERAARAAFRDQLRLRFAYTAYTHVVRGVSTHLAKRKGLQEAEVSSEAIHDAILDALARCTIAHNCDIDCGDAFAWLRLVHDSTPFSKTFDDRLARLRKAVAIRITAMWDQSVDERLETLLAAKDTVSALAPNLRVSELLRSGVDWTLPRDDCIGSVALESFAQRLAQELTADRAAVLGEAYPDPGVEEALHDLEEAYCALFVVARMQRNAPMRAMKFFSAICRNVENKGKDAETTMDWGAWMATTHELFADIERQYLSNAFAELDGFVPVAEWIARERSTERDAGRRSLIAYFSLWNRLLACARPTSRAVPYLEAVSEQLNPWFLVSKD